MFEIFLASAVFTGIVVALVVVILSARAQLVNSGNVLIEINGEKTIEVAAGGKLLQTLAGENIFLSSACGGGGSCAQCKCKVFEGGGELLPTEEAHINRRMAKEGVRLSCQVAVRQNMKIEVPEDVFGVKQWQCTVTSNPNVATFIKELPLKLPDGFSISIFAKNLPGARVFIDFRDDDRRVWLFSKRGTTQNSVDAFANRFA